MATTVLTLSAERWLDEVILTGSITDAGAASVVESFLAPAGLDDLAIMNVLVSFINIGTVPVVATFPRGVRLIVISADATTIMDTVGSAPYVAHLGDGAAFTAASAYVDPDALVLWRRGELLTLNSPEMDASTTADLRIQVKCVRVRPIEQPSSILQLVR